MRVNGVVERVEEAYAWVDVSVAQGCGRCQEPGGCGGVNIARPFGTASRTVRVRNEIGAAPGDAVGVVVEDGLPLRGALRIYGWPVLGLLLGAACGTVVAAAGHADLSAGLGAAGGFLLALWLGRRRASAGEGRADLPLRLVRGGPASGGECAP